MRRGVDWGEVWGGRGWGEEKEGVRRGREG